MLHEYLISASFVEILRYPETRGAPEEKVDGSGGDLPTQGETRARPVPKPRTRLPSRGHDLATVENKAPPASTLTPSRSAPAPPTPYGGSSHSAGRHSTLPKPAKAPPTVPPYRTKTLTGSSSSSRVDILKSELAVRTSGSHYAHCYQL